MKRILHTFLGLMIVFNASALLAQEDFTQMAMDQKAKQDEIAAPYMAIARAQKNMINQKMQTPEFKATQQFATNQKNPLEEMAQEHQSVSDAIIFVSFSMPKQSLEQWLAVSNQLHIPLVLRGMIDNSIKKTEQAIIPLVKKVHGGFQINPVLYRSFNIQQVPAIVVVNHHGCHTDAECGDKQQFDVIYGQTTMNYALSQLADKGEQAPEVARALLNSLPGETHA